MFELNDLSGAIEAGVALRWGVRIPLRDGLHLNATLYLPRSQQSAQPTIITLTPYTVQTWHQFGVYFAGHGFPFLAVDARGRADSEGEFQPFIQEARDGFDVVEWVAKQSYCDGKVTMWGGSYAAYAQWVTASEFPPHLATIVPAASPFMAVDMIARNNVPETYLIQWFVHVSGRTSHDKLFFSSELFWGSQFRAWFESGVPYRQLDRFIGYPCETFQQWTSHPQPDAYWDEFNPTAADYARIRIPILTITGAYDSDQPGALEHYRQHRAHASEEVRARHYLIIGPWDHFGTRTPRREFCGLKIGPAGMLDLKALHLQWYAWTLKGGARPEFLRKNVAYYVMGAERWRYADSLEAITRRNDSLFLDSSCNPTDVFHSGSLTREPPEKSGIDAYVYDPRDVSLAALESTVEPESRTDQRMMLAASGRLLIYHSAPFEQETELSGFFKLRAWMSIDQPDTDFRAAVYEVALDGSAILLTSDLLRARHRGGLRSHELVSSRDPLLYVFERFTFVSRAIAKGARLRLVVGPIDSIYYQKNYNSGGVVADESMKDARAVTVRLFHDARHASALEIPIAAPEPH